MQKFNISYMFAGKHINIFLNRDGKIRKMFSVNLDMYMQEQ